MRRWQFILGLLGAVSMACTEGRPVESNIVGVSSPGPGGTGGSSGAGASSVQVTPSNAQILVGQTAQLSAVVRDVGGTALTSVAVVWTSSNPSVAVVSEAGLVTGLRAGVATVTAFAGGASGTSAILVIQPAVATFALSPSALSLLPGQTTQLLADARDAAGTVIPEPAVQWTSSAPAIATVSATGVVTAIAPGQATITAVADTKSATASVVVGVEPVASVSVRPSVLSLVVGSTAPLVAEARDAQGRALSGRPVMWSSDAPTIVAVSADGIATGLAVGTAVVTASVEGRTATATISVSPVAVSSVTVTPSSVSLVVGQSATLTGTPRDANGFPLSGRTVTWSTSSIAIATVSPAGVVSAAGAGTATLTASSEGQSGTATVTVTLVPVASVTVSPTSLTLNPGGSAQLTATPRDAQGSVLTGRTVTWSTSNSAVAIVSSAGVVSAGVTGNATITANVGGASVGVPVTVVAVGDPVPSITPASGSIVAGQTLQLTAEMRDAGGAVVPGVTFTWSTNNSAVATVSSSGLVTGVNAGIVTISATAQGKTATASITVTPVPVASVTVAPSSATLVPGQTTQLVATARDAGSNVLTGRLVVWSSTNAFVAAVSSSGLVTAQGAGSAIITASVEGQSASSSITVTVAPVASVVVAPSTVALFVGDATTLTATSRDAAGTVLTGRPVSWSSGNAAVATVSSSGVVTAVGTGSVTITAVVEGQSASATVTVSPVPVASVSVTPATASLDVGQTAALSATPLSAAGVPLSGRAVTWSSSNTAVAAVSSSGVVTALGSGTATISATSEGKVGSASVTVAVVAAGGLTLSPTTLSLQPGSSAQIVATVFDTQGRVLTGRFPTWSSSNTAVVTVSSSGVVTAVGTGTATIVATIDGHTARTTVTVGNGAVASVTISPTSPAVAAGSTVQLSATARDASGAIVSGRTVAWSSSDTAIATVSSAGLLTGVSVGSATISAVIDSVTGTVTASVTTGGGAGGDPFGVASVSVTPASITMIVGQSSQLSGTARDSRGNAIIGPTILWSSSDPSVASVSSSGVVTGISIGSAIITGSAGAGSGSSTVFVSAGSQLFPNEPIGFTALSERPFSAKVESGWDNFELTQPFFTIVADATGPKSPGSIARILYPAGFAGGSSPAVLQRSVPFNQYTRLYLSFWMRVSTNWQGHRTGTLKVHHMWSANKNRVVFTVEGAGSNPLLPTIRLQGSDLPDSRSFLWSNLSSNQVIRGRWHRVEVLIINSSVSKFDGEAHWWLDGVKVGQYTDIGYISTSAARFWELVQYSPTWGGQLDTVLQDQTLDMDHMYISVAP